MKILQKEVLADADGIKVTKMELSAAQIAKKAFAGQFVVVMVSEEGERIPLTIAQRDPVRGTITLIFQEVGLTTKLLGKLNVGDSIYALAGPLGHATEIKNYGNVIVIGGGVGIAEVFPVAKALKGAGNNITTIVGARNKELLILEKELKALSEKLYITTDDGSYGERGLVTDILKELLESTQLSYDVIYTVGPIPMMAKVCQLTKVKNIKTIVSLNALMVDATGMCGCCRVTVGGNVKFSCVDGPEFDGHSVDWDELGKRSNIYVDSEQHICRLKNL